MKKETPKEYVATVVGFDLAYHSYPLKHVDWILFFDNGEYAILCASGHSKHRILPVHNGTFDASFRDFMRENLREIYGDFSDENAVVKFQEMVVGKKLRVSVEGHYTQLDWA